MKKFWVGLVVVIIVVCAACGLLVRSWTITDHGRLDTRVAVLLKLNELVSNPDYQSISDKREKLERSSQLFGGKPIPFQNIQNTEIPGPAGNIPIRIYTPDDPRPMPVIVFYHGGGWVAGSLNTHENVCRKLAKGSNAIVISVAYRLAPEYPFPAGIDDSYAALQWVAENAGSFGGDATRIAVAGDSAGGNFAAIVTQMARDNNGPAITAQALIYPATNFSDFDTESYQQNGTGYMLLKENMEMYRDMYLPQKEDWYDPKASPLLAQDFAGLPPAIIITAEFDPLRDDGEAYAAKLKAAGVPTEEVEYKGFVHAFLSVTRFLPKADEAIDQVCQFLKGEFKQ
ncbi:MAG: alpha/beta hydrolase [Syntrophomonadaceae bacterium]|nr:alpha/beta hydrolase [Syntrophomonadaceae bacterium]